MNPAASLRTLPPGLPTFPVDDLAFSAADGESELMGIRINEVDQADAVLVLRLPGRAIAVPAAALETWRVRKPAAKLLRYEGTDYVALSSIPGVRWREDTASQTLMVQVPSTAFFRNEFEVVNPEGPAQSIAKLGGFVNYDVQLDRAAAVGLAPSTHEAAGLIEAGAFNAFGNGLASGVWRSGALGSSFTRLDTSLNVDLTTALSSVRVGDSISVPGAWGHAVRFGGVQWSTNFAVQPGFISFPTPSIRGEANVPSIVDLYINNVHQLQGKVPAGAFDLPDVPVITGQGQIKMVVRDVLGREQVIVQPYYVSPTLLRPGLHDFSLESGTVRINYGFESQHYGRAFFSATDRVGVTPTFTRELHAELLREQQTLGVNGVWQIRQQATANVSTAVSRGPAGTGALLAGGIDHQDTRWSANLQFRLSSRTFASLGDAATTVGPTNPVGPPRSSLTAGFAAPFAGGSAGLTVLQQASWGTEPYRAVTFNYGRHLGVFGFVSVFASRTFGSVAGTTVGINLITLLGGNASASVSSYLNRDRSTDDSGLPINTPETRQTTVQLQSSPPAGPGFGYLLQADQGTFDRFSAEGTLQGDRATLTVGAARANRADAYRLGLRGAVALMPEGVFLSRRIEGSFAVVQVGDYGGVRVNRDNQFVGLTDEHGRAFVTGLRGYESNQISVEPGDLPLDAQVDQLKISVAPGMRSGVSVLFPVRRTRSATMRLVTADGEPVPAGATVRIDGDTRDYPVGFDGKVFLSGLGDSNRISAAWEGHRCTLQVALELAPDDVPELGTQVCK